MELKVPTIVFVIIGNIYHHACQSVITLLPTPNISYNL